MKKILLQIYFNKVLALSIIIILSLVLIVPVFAGCSGTAASNTFIELLNLVPADFASIQPQPSNFLTLTDFASYFKDYNITFTNFEELIEKIRTNHIIINIGGGSHITGWGRFAQTSTIQDKYVGYNVSNIDAEIAFGAPPHEGVAAIGRLSPQATKDALKNQAEWPSWAVTAYTTEEYHGITIHGWGSGFEAHFTTKLLPPHIDEIGRARPLAVTERYLFYGPSVEAVKLMIDASNDDYSSLADLPEYAAIANGLADLKAYTAIVGKESLVNGNPENIGLSTRLGLKRFLTFGSGMGSDGKGIYTAIVLYHENPDDALANVSLLKQRIENPSSDTPGISWIESISETDIWAEGNTLLAKLYSDSPLIWQRLVYN